MNGAAITLLVILAGLLAPATAAAVPAIDLKLIATASQPLHVTHAGDSRLFIAQRNGVIRIYAPGTGLLATPFLDLSSVVVSSFDGGLFSLAFHPQYASNGRFFVSYTIGGSPLTSVLARYEVSAGDPNVANPTSGVTLLSWPEPGGSHNIGPLAFGPDGLLYIGAGDGGVGNCNAQKDGLFHGKLLRIDVDQNVGTPPHHGIPPSNPYASAGDGVLDAIWAHGFRNPWRISFDRATGELWIGDVGENTREEVDRQPAASSGGENYGWRVMEGTSCIDPDPIDPDCPVGTASCGDPSYTLPVYEYATGANCAVTGGFVYRGTAIPDLIGHYVFGDVCTARIWMLTETTPGVFTRDLLIDAESPVQFGLTTFGEDQDGELYVAVGDEVYRLVRVWLIPASGGVALAALAALLAATTVAALWLRRRSRAPVKSPILQSRP